MTVCIACNREGGEGPLCMNCGERLPAIKTCPRCGAKAEPMRRYCTGCGLALEPVPAVKVPAVETASLPKDVRREKAAPQAPPTSGAPAPPADDTVEWRGIQIGDAVSLLRSIPGSESPSAAPSAQATGIRIGDNKSEITTNIERVIIGTPPPAAESLDFCPICGEYPEKRDSFRCLQCRRGPICKKHRDPDTSLCPDCARPLVEEKRRVEAVRQDDEAFAAARAKGGIAALMEYESRFPAGRHSAQLRPPQNPAAGDVWIPSADGCEMVWIPAGDFTMGSPESESGDGDETQHTVRIERGFWIDCWEVTNEAYRKFILANPHWQKGNVDGKYDDGYYLHDWDGNDYLPGKGDHPVVYVSWHAALAYAEWAGKRLPTEAEWEYACRAGTTTAFWWGDRFDGSRANNSQRGTTPKGDERHRNAWGLYDMSGNVWDWTASLYGPYPFGCDVDREAAVSAGARVCRGGAWCVDPKDLRSASRSGRAPKGCSIIVGFRCAMEKRGHGSNFR